MNVLTIPRRLRHIALAAVVLVATLIGIAAPASAAIFAGGGKFGYYQTGDGTCRSRLFGPTKVVDLTAPAPRAWAVNRQAGRNNDSAWVRYRVFVVNANSGATVTSSGYSGWARATDVTPAAWNGGTTFSLDGTRSYRVETRVEWWNSTARTGWIADRTLRYRMITTWGVNIGVVGSCSFVSR